MSERRVTTKRARSDAEEDSNVDHNDDTQSHAHISSQLAARLGPVHARHRRAMSEQRSTTPSQLWRAVEEATREDERAYVDDSVRIEENVESSSTSSNLNNNNNNIDDDNNITQINVNELDWRQEPHLRQLELQGQTLVECLPFTRLRRTLLSSDARTPYRAVPHSLRSVNHWGQRKLMLSELEFLTRHGVYHMDGSGAVGDSADGAEVTYENLRTAMDEAAKYGVSLEMIHIEIPRGIILACSMSK